MFTDKFLKFYRKSAKTNINLLSGTNQPINFRHNAKCIKKYELIICFLIYQDCGAKKNNKKKKKNEIFTICSHFIKICMI